MSEALNNFRFSDAVAVLKLYEAIGQAQDEFKPVPKKKDGQVGSQKFKYADYKTLVKCIRPALLAKGVHFIQALHTEENKSAVTLVVSGHGAQIASTFLFDAPTKPQDFGKDSTYYRRYQLQSFFCLEGDKDADDPDDDDDSDIVVAKPAETKPVVVQKQPEKKAVSKAVVDDLSEIAKAEPKVRADKPVEGKASGPESIRSPNELLMDAKKQLNWEMKDFDAFCKEHPSVFPNFVAATKLTGEEKILLFKLLVSEKNVVPF